MDIQFKLNKKAVDIFNELIELEYMASFTKIQLAVELLYLGYNHASQKFYDDAGEELGHAKTLTDFLVSRGHESQSPEIKIKPIGIKDLKDAIKKSYELEIQVTQAYDEAIREMFGLDIMAFNSLQGMMGIQVGEIESARQAYMTFEFLSVDDQRQMEAGYYSQPVPTTEG